jgi:hypothetical protein
MFVLTEMRRILTSLTRGLDLQVLTSGFGEERGVPISYQAQTPVLGLVLPSNSPGVHTLWLPIIPLQIGLVLKPGPQEPWTPFRMAEAFFKAGVPREAISIYPGEADVGAAVLANCERSLVFGGQPTVDRYRGNPKVQAHGPGFSKIVLGDDEVDKWEQYLDVMLESIFANSGAAASTARASGPAGILVTSRSPQETVSGGTRCQRITRREPRGVHRARRRRSDLAIDRRCAGSRCDDVTNHRDSPRGERRACGLSHPRSCTLVSRSGDRPQKNVPVRGGCRMSAGSNDRGNRTDAVCSAITHDARFRRQLVDAVNIDRLNLGPVPTIQLNWLQPHEGNIVDFLFRARAFQTA